MTRPLVLLVSVLSFAASAFGLVERPVSQVELTQVEAYAPAIVSNGEHYVAAWTDSRDPRRPAVYGARITADRKVLDPVGVRLMEQTSVASIASGLGHTFVLGRSLAYAIVDRDGRVVARGQVADEPATNGAQVVFNGSDFVVFWANNALRTSTLDPFGGVVRWPDNVVTDRAVTLHSASTDGARILVTYTFGQTLYVAGTGPEGQRLWTDKLVAGDVAFWGLASIASANGVFAVAWLGLDDAVHTIRLDANGDAMAPSRTAIPWSAPVRIVAANEGFRLFEQQELRVMNYALTDDLVPVTATPVIDLERPAAVVGFAVAEGPGGTMVVASLGRFVSPSVQPAGLYALDGDTPEERVPVARAGITQTGPDAALGEDGMLVAWREAERSRAAATFFAADGTVRRFSFAGNVGNPVVAAQGSAYLIVDVTPAGVRARAIRGGQPIGEEVAVSGEPGVSYAVAADGRDFVVATTRGPIGVPLLLTRIDTEGRVVSRAGVPISDAAHASRVNIACDGGECLLVWLEQTLLSPPCRPSTCVHNEDVRAVRLDSALVSRDPVPIVVQHRLTSGYDVLTGLDVAAFDGTYAVASQTPGRIFARTLSRAGQLGTTFELPGTRVAVERDGDAWLLVREAGAELLMADFTADSIQDRPAFPAGVQWRSAPALTRRDGNVVLAYERTTIGEEAGGVVRTYVATLAAPKRRTTRH